MSQLVLTEAGDPPEGLPTLVTLKWFLGSVCSRVGKAGAAQGPRDWGAPRCMHELVLSQRGALAEGFPAFPAQVGPLSRVRPLVSDQLGLLAEGLPTLAATIGPLSRVDPLMVDEAGALTKGLPTLITPVGLLPSVSTLMLNEF